MYWKKKRISADILVEKLIYKKTNITSMVNVYFTGSLISISMYDDTKSWGFVSSKIT